MDMRQRKAIENQNKKRLLAVNPKLDDESGIYFLTRVDENGFKYAYIGQALHIAQRLCSHMVGYQHIDLSLKKHGLYDFENNPYGWKIGFMHFPKNLLDSKEQYYIKMYAENGYQLRNKTAGGQGDGKSQIDEYRPARGYRDGILQGKKVLARNLSSIAQKYLKIELRDEYKGKKVPERQFEKFKELMNEDSYKESEQ